MAPQSPAQPLLDRELRFWKQRLAGVSPLQLPTDRLPQAGRGRWERLPLALSPELSRTLRQQGGGEEDGLFVTLLAAFEVLLYRHTHQEDLTIGALLHRGTQGGAAAPIGPVDSPLVLRTAVSGAPTFQAFRDTVRQVLAEAMLHRELPFEALMELLRPQLMLGRPMPLQAMFVLGEARPPLPETAEPTVAPELTLKLSDGAQGLAGWLEYNAGLFHPDTVGRIAKRFEVLLQGIVADPHRRLAELPIMTDEERQLLVRWNETRAPYPDGACIHQLFEAQVERTPEATALVVGDARLNYRELNRRANQLAHHLRQLGVGPEVLVGLCMERSVEMVVGLLGILKAGGAYVPLDPLYPKDRIAFMLEDAGGPVLLTQQRLLQDLPGSGGTTLCLDTDWERIEGNRDDNPGGEVRSGNLAYVIYTSGSTGKPKGVAIQHHSAVVFLEWAKGVFDAGELEGVLASTSICFDLSVFELFGPLTRGGKVVMAQNALHLPGLPAAREVTLINTVPSAIAQLLRMGAVPPSVKVVNLAGEALLGPLVRQIYEVPTIARVLNLYGPTEDTTYSTYGVMDRGEVTPPIGRPISNTQVHLLDAALRPVPVGVIGELYLSGEGLARGYLRRPELTAERFIPDPYGPPGSRMYRTGDLARYRPDGVLDYLGRGDQQVKIRGFRIELGEVESVLARHPGLRECVVVAREDATGSKRLVAYIVAKQQVPTVGELRGFVKERLPDHMVPSVFVPMEALPLTPNGKVDRRALPEPDLSRPELDEAFVAPRTAMEARLAEVWGELLGLGQVGINDNFFELGGHSLIATQLVARLREAFGLELPLPVVFRNPTVARLAELIESKGALPKGLGFPPIQVAPRGGELPLTFPQEQVWFLSQLAPENFAYNFQMVIELEGPVDVGVMERTLAEITRRHEMLRTSFHARDGRPYQAIHPVVPLRWSYEDLRDVTGCTPEEEMRRRVEADILVPFDIAEAPLTRWRLYRLAEQRYGLLHVEHHLVHDGWSISVFVRELQAIYPAFLAGQPSPLPELSVQFADFAVWQRNLLQGELLERELAYWRKVLAVPPPMLELPTDRPRPRAQSFKGEVIDIPLPEGLYASVKELCRQRGTTFFMVLESAFLTLMHRYTGLEDVVIGSGAANRRLREAEKLIGMIVNTFVIRADLSGAPRFTELLERVRDVNLDVYNNQDVPLMTVVKAVQPDRDLKGYPLVQVIFAFHDSAVPEVEFGGLNGAVRIIGNHSAKFELNVTVIPLAEQRAGMKSKRKTDSTLIRWEYSSDIFDPETIVRLAGHFHRLLESVVRNPEQRLLELQMLDEAERHKLLVEWNQTRVSDLRERACAPALFEAQVDRAPEAVAVSFGGTQLTYRELDRRANQLAHHLRTLGVGPEVRVGLCVDRSPEMVVGILGILKAGAAYVPVDPAYPMERIGYMLESSGAAVVLSQERVADTLLYSGQLLCLDSDRDRIARAPEHRPAVALDAGNLAYVIFTSGSTGRPKGTLLTHGSLGNTARAAIEALHIRPDSRVLQFASFGFDASVWEIFSALFAGARLCLAPKEELLPGPALQALIREQGVTVMTLTPSALAQLEPREVPGVETVVSAGEACPPELARAWGMGRRFINAYGPTEATICATLTAEVSAERPTIGRPLPNVRVYVLDPALQPVPIGVPGELYVGGAGLARGYLGRPELTAERFVPDPFGTEPGGRLYRTGDLARYRPSGEIEFFGRVDSQVKLRGFRIELGEVELTLAQHPSVREAVAVVREDEAGNRWLVAYVVGRGAEAPDAGELRSFLKERLPEFMVPSAFVALEALPLTAHGKVDRKALPAPEVGRAAAVEFVAPRTLIEEMVAGIWAQLLGLDRVGVHDNFFELGGHSLVAIQVIARLRDSVHVEVPLRHLFENATVERLAGYIEAAQRAGGGSTASLPELGPISRGGALPLSFAQQRLWFLERLEPGTAAYNFPVAMRIRGALDVRALEESLRELVRRHEALRTTFGMADGQPVQLIAGELPLDVVAEGLEDVPEAAREEEARRRVWAEARRPFDVEKGPLLRVTLLRLRPDEHVLLILMHHIVTDGWSIGVMMQELAALYGARGQAGEAGLPELPVQYADYAAWQRGWLKGEVVEQQLGYWRKQLAAPLPVLELPVDRPRAAVQTFRGARYWVKVPKELTGALRALGRREGVTLYMTLLAAFDILLARYSGQEDLVVGMPVAGRNRREVEGLIGFFVNMLAMRVDVGGNPSFRTLLERVREVCLGAYAHQDIPFERLVDEVEPVRDLSRTPLFQSVFILQSAATQRMALPGLEVAPVDVDYGAVKYDLTLELKETDSEGLTGLWAYNTDLFDASSMERMTRHFQRVLEAIVAAPEVRVREVPLLDEEERRRVLVEWNRTGAEYEKDACLHRQFEARAAQQPEALAVASGGRRLTYGELNRRANGLARRLKKLGVGPEQRVVLCTEPSVERVVGALGILKAGGAYVPLDAAHPGERLRWMRGDSGARVVVTQERHAGVFREAGVEVVCLEGGEEAAGNVESGVEAGNLAYVIYTSGSTGWPKGVEVSHRSLSNLVGWHRREYGVGKADRATQLAGPAFDASVWEVWPYLTAGASVYVVGEEERSTTGRLMEWMAQEGITLCFLPTPLAEAVMEGEVPEGSKLRSVLTGGDRLRRRPAAGWGPAVVNHYGPTENAVVATCGAVEPGGEKRLPSIGRPIANVQVYVLDEALQPVPVGVTGELYVGGESLARGYQGRPELTAERFVPNPFGAGPGERLYRTGDVVRYLPDGRLEFLGRRDEQVKVRGFRIELGEVEGALGQHPGVREAVVVAREGGGGNKRLVAYVVSGQEKAPGAEELRAFLKERLPEYMVPAAYVALEKLPLTANGKVDRKALPDPEEGRDGRGYVAPRTPVEEKLAAVWQAVLRVERVGVEDNFFELGGDSILSLQVVAKAGQEGLRVTPRQVFQHQTVAELARVVEAGRRRTGEQGEVQGEVALTPIQRWFLERGLEEAHHFNQAVMLEVEGEVDAGRLEKALDGVVRHHDALRMRYVRGGDGWRQVNAGMEKPFRLERVDVSGSEEGAEAGKLQRSLKLDEGLLLRAALFNRGAGKKARLLLVAHHLVVDFVSWRVLAEDVESAYAGRALPEKTTSFQEWARRLTEYARTAEVEKEAASWLEEAGRPVKALPVDRAGGPNVVGRARRVSASLSEEETRALLQEVPGAYRAHIDEVLLAGLAQSLGRWVGEGRVVVDMEGHGREELFEEVDVSRTVGWFTAVYPVALEVSGHGTAGESLGRVKERMRRVPGRGLGYGLLRYSGREEVARKLKALPVAQVGFNYLGQLDGMATGGGAFRLVRESTGPARSDKEERSHLLEVSGVVLGGRLEVAWEYAEGMLRRETVEELARQHVAGLRWLIVHRSQPEALVYTPSDFPLAQVGSEALARILEKAGRLEDLYPLSPMQEGILFHALLAPGSGTYFEQLSWTSHGALDAGALRRAWQAVLDRHPILRTAFYREGLDRPLQGVSAGVELPWAELDWRGTSPEGLRRNLDAFLKEDRARGFDLGRAPLMRVTLIREQEGVHRCVWSFHHLLLDGWSVGLVLKEVFALYGSQGGSTPPKVERVPSFREYIAWLQKQEVASAEAYWRRSLEGFREPTALPGEKGTAGAPGYAEQVLRLPEELTGQLLAQARKHQVTLNTLVQAAWALVLSRYSGQDDVVFGVTVAGRPPELAGAEGMVGLLINSLPLRVTLGSDETVLRWLQRLQAWQVELRQYEHCPLVQIQEWSEVPRGTPLFESLFVFENYPMDSSVREGPGPLDVRELRAIERTTYPLTAVSGTPRQGLPLKLLYETPRFDGAAAGQLLRHWRMALEAIAFQSEQRLQELSLLSGEERRTLLVEWNDTRTAYPREASIPSLFEAQVERTPDSVAVSFGGRPLTYRELNVRSNQLAHRLRSLGVGPGTPVALCMERSLEMVVATLGILKAGGAYVPLDPSYPRERLAFMLEDTRTPVLLTQPHLLDVLPPGGVQRLCLAPGWEALAGQPGANPESGAVADGLAYIIYTSGSTGRPKGVCVPHRAVVRLVMETNFIHLTAEDRVAQASNSSFDAATFELWGALLHGARLVGVEKDVVLSPKAFAERIRDQQISVLFVTTALFNQVASEVPEAFRPLRQLHFGGEAVDPKWVRTVLEQGRPGRLLHVYGPTESTTFATWYEVGQVEDGAKTVPIGGPLANTRLYVLDGQLRLVPPGAAGELYIGGDGLAWGYLNRPEQTAEKFVPHPFGEPGERLYRTGDRVRYRRDGSLEFIGRRDTQVKVRGFRIEPGEVEAALVQHPGVREGVVMAREDVPGDRQLVAYFIPAVAGAPGAGALRAFLKEKLPEYMVPSAFVALEALPLTPNGKVDRRLLPAPDALRLEPEVFAAPRTAIEEMVAGTWEQVLHRKRVGIHDNFFELGGHSLRATQVVSRLGHALQVELPLGSLFEGPTVAELALAIEARLRQARGTLAPAIVPVPRSGALPPSFAQQRLWFLEQLEPGDFSYNVPHAVRLTGRLDTAALERSLQQIVKRHEVLRTTFSSVKGQPVQVIAPELSLRVAVEDLEGLAPASREAEAKRRATEEVRRPFDLKAGPLMRATLLRLAPEEHVLVLVMHHIVCDGWSLGVFVRELSALYGGFAQGGGAGLPELPVQYADFASWQRQWLQGAVLDGQLAYWRERLAGPPPVLELPLDRPRPAVRTSRGAHLRVKLPRSLSGAVAALSRQEGATLYMTLLGAFDVLLARYSGQTDLVVGSPIAGRTRPEVENLIGFFVNTLALRVGLSGEPGFRTLLGRVRDATLGAYAHQDVPLEQLVEELRPERSLGRTPLFQVVFALQNASEPVQGLPGLALGTLEVEPGTAKFDLTVSLKEGAEGLEGFWEYSTDLFNPDTIVRMAGHFERLLEGIVRQPEARVWELPLLGEGERRQVLEEWNQTRVAFPQEEGIHRLFEAQVARTPEAVAVELEGQRLSYRELDRRANQVARYLRRLGVGVGTPVGLCVERSVEMVVGTLGILKAGGAYVPLDPAYPRERLGFMLEDTGVRVLVGQRKPLAALPPHGAKEVALDEAGAQLERESAESPGVEVPAESLAYVMYTSGSTGRPKGVCVPHRAVVRLVKGSRFVQMGEREVFLQLAPISFDASTLELWGSLLNGAKLAVFPAHAPTLEEIGQALERHGVTTLWLTAALFEQMQASQAKALGRVRQVLAGGDVLPVRRVKERLAAGGVLINGYGPTENTTFTCCHVMTGVEQVGHTVPIGRPIANTQAYVLDERMQPVPVGVAGELYAGGAGLAWGYLNRPELTAERFVPHPFGAPGERLYRTGDLVRHLPDGTLEFLGRRDEQVKVRGYRIELGEVETVLGQHPGVREAVVVAGEDGAGGKRLVAYYVVAGGAPAADELRAFLREKLPEYMVPSAFMALEALPLSPNGKVDRKALPAPDAGHPDPDTFVAPRNAVEELVAGIWARLLGLDRVGVHDNFFALGGHSLVATQVMSWIRETFHVELPLRSLFEAPTVEGLARHIESTRQDSKELELSPIVPVPRQGALPLSFAQQRVWFLEQLQPGGIHYHVPLGFRVKGRLDVDALERSFQELIRRHEVLRTTFALADGQPVQVIAAEPTLPFAVESLEGLPVEAREQEAQRRAMEEALRPFDLGKGPLMRVTLLRLTSEEHVLVLVLHHIVCDAWSMGVLGRELSACYAAFSTGAAPALPALPIQYADYAQWQRQWLRGELLESRLAYWKRKLDRPPVLELPTDRPRPAVQTFHGGYLRISLSRALSVAISDLARREGASLFMTMLAPFQVLLYRYTGQQDFVVGSPIAGRNRREQEGLIGFFVNTLALRADLSDGPSFRTVLGRVRESCLEAYEHQELPFEQIVDALQLDRDLSRAPLFQVMFSVQDAAVPLALGGASLRPIYLDRGASKFDFTVECRETEEGLVVAWEYNTDLFDQDTVARVARHYQRLLEAIVANPEQRIQELPMLEAVERHRLLVEWNATATPPQRENCIHRLFEAQVDRVPDAVAVSFGGAQLTYRELDQRANRLAHHLRSLGVGPEVRVGLCVERSLEMVVGILGVLKAGAAYVPVDPMYPVDRIAYMLESSGAAVVLSQEKLADTLPFGGQLVCLDSDWEQIARAPEHRPAVAVDVSNAAYVIFTSGSTGRPKGTVLTHGGLCNTTRATMEAWRLHSNSRVLQFASPGFDASVWELFTTLCAGARLCPAPREALPGPALHALLREQGVTVIMLTPSALAHLDPREVPAVETVVSGGEACPPELARTWEMGRRFINAYGPTEITICATLSVDMTPERPTIGRPLPNVQVYVLDPALQPVPVGVQGELYVGGAGLGRGYLGRPELTAERFVPDPFSGVPGSRLYRSGDLVRYMLDGNLEYMGRVDQQVKVRGVRIELGEVEAALAGYSGVQQAAVVARTGAAGEKRLVAYVVPAAGAALAGAEIREHLRTKLPEVMVPSAFVMLEALPLTANGKLDVRALPEPEAGGEGVAFVEPRTELERSIATIWCEVLGVEKVGMNDRFFDVGGNSLTIVQLNERLRNRLGLGVELMDLFQYPTIGTLSQHLTGKSAEEEPLQGGRERGETRKELLAQRKPSRRGSRDRKHSAPEEEDV